MIPNDRVELRLPERLDDLVQPRTPDYLEDLLRLTASTSQRPPWKVLQWWVPRLRVGRLSVFGRKPGWRPVLVLLLVGLLLAAGLAVLIGSKRTTPAPPFGPARNGLIAYASDGDVYTADPVTGVSTRVVAGTGKDEFPTFSPDGTRLAFIRMSGSTDGLPDGRLVVADVDGSHVTPLMPEHLTGVSGFEFSPDDGALVVSSTIDGRQEISVSPVDGSASTVLELSGLPPALSRDGPSYRPFHAHQVMFAGWGYAGGEPVTTGIYLVDDDGTDLQTLVEPEDGVLRWHPIWSPDGSMVAYTRIRADSPNDWELHVVTVKDKLDRAVHTSDAVAEGWPAWSPDGTRLLIQRIKADGSHSYAVVPADGSGPGIEIKNDRASTGALYAWAPDSTVVLSIADVDPSTMLIWDATTGTTTRQPWNSTPFGSQGHLPAWQRVAP
jgi:dipeptidyl aminopeptidase/acylaminoacyl peptidase